MFGAVKFVLLISLCFIHSGLMNKINNDTLEMNNKDSNNIDSTDNIHNDELESFTFIEVGVNGNAVTTFNDSYYNPEDSEPFWLDIFHAFQAAMVVIGFFLNLLTLVTLRLNGTGFKPVIRALLCHQAFIDMGVCVMTLLIVLIPSMWVAGDGHNTISFIFCQAFHSQALYWGVFWISITSLEVIAWERFMAICKPLKHAELTTRHIWTALIALYPLSPLVCCLSYVQVKFHDGQCLPQFYYDSLLFKNIMRGFSYYSFLILYAIPCAAFFIFYGSIVVTLVRRQNQSQLAQSRIIDSATKQLTKTAMVVTGWYIIALGYDLWYYILGYNNVVVYKKNSPVQKAGIFLAGSNSCVNPIIYALFMPAYRASVKMTFGCAKLGSKTNAAAGRAKLATVGKG